MSTSKIPVSSNQFNHFLVRFVNIISFCPKLPFNRRKISIWFLLFVPQLHVYVFPVNKVWIQRLIIIRLSLLDRLSRIEDILALLWSSSLSSVKHLQEFLLVVGFQINLAIISKKQYTYCWNWVGNRLAVSHSAWLLFSELLSRVGKHSSVGPIFKSQRCLESLPRNESKLPQLDL